jgi:hypothetical protein
MTADELIKQLQKLPPETPVRVEGYETGFDDIVELKSVDVFWFRKAAEWDGEYQTPDNFTGSGSRTSPAAALLGRRGHLRNLVEQAEGERSVSGRFRMSTDALRQIGQSGADLLADTFPDNMEEFSRRSKAKRPD